MKTVAQEIELPDIESQPAGAPLLLPGAASFLRSVKVRVSLRVGQAEVTVGALSDMKLGEVLALDRLVDQPLDVLVDEHVVARGTLVAVGDRFGVRLTETPSIAPAMPAAST